MKLWLSRRPNGRYILTSLRPTIKHQHGTTIEDLYVTPGDRIGLPGDMCDMLAKQCGVTLLPLGSVKVELSARVVD